jgi:hypothetical protein
VAAGGRGVIRPLRFYPIRHFVFAGELRELRDPDGIPSARQLLKLNALGALLLVEPCREVRPITKGDAAGALDVLLPEDEAA